MDRFQPMAPSNEAPNPLRPYYRPPSIVLSNDNHTAAAPKTAGASSSFGTSARDILSDMSYNEILGDSNQSATAGMRTMLDQAVWRYSSVFMTQPFEMAKLILQVRLATAPVPSRPVSVASSHRQTSSRYQQFDEFEDDEEEDEPQYFTSVTPDRHGLLSTPTRTRRVRREQAMSPELIEEEDQPQPPLDLNYIVLKKQDSLSEVIGQLWGREGAFGIWKGTNVTFLYSLLLRTIETWTRSMLAATLNLPDPGVMGLTGTVGGLDIIDSPSPLASLIVAVTASTVAGLMLAPLDIVRTRLMLTPSTAPKRSIMSCLRELRSWSCPPSLFAPVLIHSSLPTLISTSTPLFLRSYLYIDPIIRPTAYSVCTFLSSTAELFMRLPIETVLRRGQMQEVYEQHQQTVLALASSRHQQRSSRSRGRTSRQSEEPEDLEPLETVVEIGSYTGIVSTMYRIVYEEGESLTSAAKPGPQHHLRHLPQTTRKGQGVQGLWRGWRLGWWGLVGVWGAAAMGGGGSSKAGEF